VIFLQVVFGIVFGFWIPLLMLAGAYARWEKEQVRLAHLAKLSEASEKFANEKAMEWAEKIKPVTDNITRMLDKLDAETQKKVSASMCEAIQSKDFVKLVQIELRVLQISEERKVS